MTSVGRVADLAQKAIEPLRHDMLELLQALIRTNSVAVPPNGDETPCQKILAEFLRSRGVEAELYEISLGPETSLTHTSKGRNLSGRKNLTARVGGSGGGRSLLLNGHMDSVPPGPLSSWNAPPWSGGYMNDRVYGLGSFDMKGGLVAQAAVLCAMRVAGMRLAGDLRFDSVIDEEWGGGAGTFAAALRDSNADACIIAEGTQLGIYRATRGGAVIDIFVEETSASNYFSESKVTNPAEHLSRLLSWVQDVRLRREATVPTGAYSTFPDPTPLQILAIESNRMGTDVPLSVPSRAAIRIYFQFLPDEDIYGILSDVQKSLRKFEQNDEYFRHHPLHWLPLYDPPLFGHEVAEVHPWVQCLLEAGSTVIGSMPSVTAAPFPCDAHILDRKFQIPVLIFGPCGGGAHNPNEYVDFPSVVKTAEVIFAAALHWCNRVKESR